MSQTRLGISATKH
jgi:mevalonate pyrophosphate decarboxylase